MNTGFDGNVGRIDIKKVLLWRFEVGDQVSLLPTNFGSVNMDFKTGFILLNSSRIPRYGETSEATKMIPSEFSLAASCRAALMSLRKSPQVDSMGASASQLCALSACNAGGPPVPSSDASVYTQRATHHGTNSTEHALECAGTRLRCASTRPGEVQLAAP